MRRTAALLLLLFLLPASAVWAHRIVVGVGSQSVFSIRRSEVEIAFNLEFAGLAAFQEMRKFDKDHNRKLDEKERKALVDYVGERIAKETSLLLDGKELEPAQMVLEDDRSLLIGDLDVLPFDTWWKFVYTFEPLEPEKSHSLVFLDKTYEGEVTQQLFWLRFEDQEVDTYLIVEPSESQIALVRDALQVANHRRIELEIGVLDAGPVTTDEGAEGPPTAEGTQDGTSGEEEPFRPGIERQEEQEETEKIRGNFDRAMRNPMGMVIALLLSAFWGAAHALGPGHGKTLVAAYLVGSRGRVRDALVLGGVATFAHTFSIFIIGAALIWIFSDTMAQSQAVLQTWVGAASGGFIVLIGVLVLRLRIRALGKEGNDHDHHHGHHHSHTHAHPHEPPEGGLETAERSEDRSGRLHAFNLISLGFSGGMVPCPSGLALIIFAFSRNQPVLGITLLTAFSLGLGLVLVSIGVAMVMGKSILASWFTAKFWKMLLRVLPIVSACTITGVGIWITMQALLEGMNKGVFG